MFANSCHSPAQQGTECGAYNMMVTEVLGLLGYTRFGMKPGATRLELLGRAIELCSHLCSQSLGPLGASMCQCPVHSSYIPQDASTVHN